MAEALILTNGKLAHLAEGLASLDGLRTKPDEFRPYKFDSDEVVWAIANNAVLVADALKVFGRAKKLLAVQHGIADRMQITPANADAVAAFMDGVSKLEDKEVTVAGLVKIARSKLNVGKNQIPASVLAKLFSVLEE